jgi:hypothetical protein
MAAVTPIELVNVWNCACGYNNTTGSMSCAGTVSDGKGGTKTCGKTKNTA